MQATPLDMIFGFSYVGYSVEFVGMDVKAASCYDEPGGSQHTREDPSPWEMLRTTNTVGLRGRFVGPLDTHFYVVVAW